MLGREPDLTHNRQSKRNADQFMIQPASCTFQRARESVLAGVSRCASSAVSSLRVRLCRVRPLCFCVLVVPPLGRCRCALMRSAAELQRISCYGTAGCAEAEGAASRRAHDAQAAHRSGTEQRAANTVRCMGSAAGHE